MTKEAEIQRMSSNQLVDFIKEVNQGPICKFCAYDAAKCHSSNVDCENGIKKYLESEVK